MAKEKKRFEFTKDVEKHGRFDFKKDGEEGSYNKIQVDLEWVSALDLDALAFLVGDEGIINDDADFVYYKSNSRWLPEDSRWKNAEEREDVDVTIGDFQAFDRRLYRTARIWRANTIPVSKDGSVIGSWDDPGSEEEDGTETEQESGETMHVILDKVGEDISEIIIGVSIHPNPDLSIPVEEQTFDKVHEAKIDIVDEETGNIIGTYNLKESFAGKTAVEVGRLIINDEGEWEFEALGEGHEGGIETLAEIYA